MTGLKRPGQHGGKLREQVGHGLHRHQPSSGAIQVCHLAIAIRGPPRVDQRLSCLQGAAAADAKDDGRQPVRNLSAIQVEKLERAERNEQGTHVDSAEQENRQGSRHEQPARAFDGHDPPDN